MCLLAVCGERRHTLGVNSRSGVGPAITQADFKNFKCLQNVSIPLASRFVLLAGTNASGKSSVLDGLDLLCRATAAVPRTGAARQVSLLTKKNDPSRLRTLGASGALEISASYHGSWIALGATPDDGIALRLSQDRSVLHQALVPNSGNQREAAGQLEQFLERPELAGMDSAVRLRLSSSRASEPVAQQRAEPHVAPDGYGLPAVLAWMAGNHRDALDAIEQDLGVLVPGAQRLGWPNQELEINESVLLQDDAKSGSLKASSVRRKVWGHALTVSFDGVGAVPADLLSDGTLLVLALLTVLHSPTCPKLLLLDDIDRALHPKAQVVLVERLRVILERNPDLQIIATTHSPYLVDQFAPSDVCLLARDANGHTHTKTLDAHPDHSQFADKLSPGEFWASVGEDWVLGEAKAAECGGASSSSAPFPSPKRRRGSSYSERNKTMGSRPPAQS